MKQNAKGEDLKVFIRFLPSMQICRENLKYNLETNTIYLRCKDAISQRVGRKTKPPQYWTFNPNKVLLNTSQEDIYDAVMTGILDKSICNCTDAVIMAYGQVGSGKTFTMTGIRSKFYQLGLIPRFITEVVQSCKRSDLRVICDVSYIEIIGQRVTDLFTGKHIKLEDMRQVPKIPLTTNHNSLERLFQAERRRKLADSNHFGNRGHGIVTFHLQTLDLLISNAEQQSFKIHFVDLAGVDSFGQTQDSGKEASDIGKSNITKSLLEQCFRHLEKPPMHYVSDLAVRFLGDSLSKDSILRFIGHVKMSKPDLTVSLSLLRFSSRIAGMKFDRKTTGPSSPNRNEYESLKSITEQMQLEAMLRNYSDYQASEKHVCNARMDMLRSKAHEYLERDFVEDVLDKKTEENLDQDDDPNRPAEPLDVYDPPIPIDFDFENDPLFNYRTSTQDELALPQGSRSKLRSQNDVQAQLESRTNVGSRSVVGSSSITAPRSLAGSRLRSESRQRVDSRLRFGSAEPPTPALDYQFKTSSPLQNLVSLKIAKEIAMQLDADGKPLKAELFNLFEKKLDREKHASELHIAPSSISKIATVSTKRMAMKDSASQGNVRKTSSKKNVVRSALSASGVTGRRQSINLVTPVVRQEKIEPPPQREIDEQGVTIGPAALYPFQGRIVELIKRTRAAEVSQQGTVSPRVETKPINANEAANRKGSQTRRQTRPPAPAPSLDSLHREEDAMANKELHKVLDHAQQEAARTRAEYFEAMRKLEWCRYQWAQANNDLQEIHGGGRHLAGAEQTENEGRTTLNNRETRLTEFIRTKRQEFHDIHHELITRREVLNNAMVVVDQAQKNLERNTYKIDGQHPDMTELIDDVQTSDSKGNDDIESVTGNR